jgi:cell division septation protein DedD
VDDFMNLFFKTFFYVIKIIIRLHQKFSVDMKIKVVIFGAILQAVFIAGCASSEKAVEVKKTLPNDVVVVDDAVSDSIATDLPNENEKPEIKDTVQTPPVQTINISDENTSYYVQVGAFKTLAKAENYAKKVRGKAKQELTVRYSKKVDLYVVRLQPLSTREMADDMLIKIRKIKGLADSFIVHE